MKRIGMLLIKNKKAVFDVMRLNVSVSPKI